MTKVLLPRKNSQCFGSTHPPIYKDLSWEERTLVIGMAKYAIDMNRIRVRAASTAPVHALSNHAGLSLELPLCRRDVWKMRKGRN
jgi:hypothetical protein